MTELLAHQRRAPSTFTELYFNSGAAGDADSVVKRGGDVFAHSFSVISTMSTGVPAQCPCPHRAGSDPQDGAPTRDAPHGLAQWSACTGVHAGATEPVHARSASAPCASAEQSYAALNYSLSGTAQPQQLDDRMSDIKESLASLLTSLREARATCDAQREVIRALSSRFPCPDMVRFRDSCVSLLRQCALMEEVVVRSTVIEATRRYLLQTGVEDSHTLAAPVVDSFAMSHNLLTLPGLGLSHSRRSCQQSPPLPSTTPELSAQCASRVEASLVAGSPDNTPITPCLPVTSSTAFQTLTAHMSGLRRFADLELFLMQHMAATHGSAAAAAASTPLRSARGPAEGGFDLAASPSSIHSTERGGSTGSPSTSLPGVARSSWHELLTTLSAVWLDVKQLFPVDAHYYDALDFLHTWGPEWYAFETRQVSVVDLAHKGSGEVTLLVAAGSPNEQRAVDELYRRLCSDNASPDCFGAIFAKVVRAVEVSGFGCQKSVPLSALLQS